MHHCHVSWFLTTHMRCRWYIKTQQRRRNLGKQEDKWPLWKQLARLIAHTQSLTATWVRCVEHSMKRGQAFTHSQSPSHFFQRIRSCHVANMSWQKYMMDFCGTQNNVLKNALAAFWHAVNVDGDWGGQNPNNGRNHIHFTITVVRTSSVLYT